MKKIFLFLVSISFLCTLRAAEKEYILQSIISKESLAESLVQNQQWVKYPSYDDRSGWNNFFRETKQSVIENGVKYLDYEWKTVPATSYLAFELTGDRNGMQNPFNSNISALATLLYAELAEGEGRFIPQIIDGSFNFCEMTSWALSAHLAIMTPQRRALPVAGDNTLELTQGDLCQLLSWVYYFFHKEFDKYDTELSRRLKAEITHRELDSYLERTDFWWMGVGKSEGEKLNNWTPWCNCNALTSFMLIEDKPERLLEAVWKSIVSNDEYLLQVQPDGAIDEGPSYWYNSAGKLYEYLVSLDLVTSGKYPLFENPKIKAMGEYIANAYMADKWVANFADASALVGFGGYPLIYRFGKSFNSDVLLSYAGMCAHNAPTTTLSSPYTSVTNFLEKIRIGFDYFNGDSQYKPLDYCWYDATEFHFSRNADGLILAAKGGYNDESHNHNDIGTFNLYIDGQPLIIDVGVGTYTKFTFSDQRYTIWTMQGQYHNVPLINGVQQLYGKNYKALDCKSSLGHFSVELARAYPQEAKVKSWIRSYDMKGRTLTVSDNFKLEQADGHNSLSFMTWGKVTLLEPGKYEIQANGSKALLEYDASKFDASVETIKLDDKKLSDVWGSEVFKIRLDAKDVVKSGKYQCKITGLR